METLTAVNQVTVTKFIRQPDGTAKLETSIDGAVADLIHGGAASRFFREQDDKTGGLYFLTWHGENMHPSGFLVGEQKVGALVKERIYDEKDIEIGTYRHLGRGGPKKDRNNVVAYLYP